MFGSRVDRSPALSSVDLQSASPRPLSAPDGQRPGSERVLGGGLKLSQRGKERPTEFLSRVQRTSTSAEENAGQRDQSLGSSEGPNPEGRQRPANTSECCSFWSKTG